MPAAVEVRPCPPAPRAPTPPVPHAYTASGSHSTWHYSQGGEEVEDPPWWKIPAVQVALVGLPTVAFVNDMWDEVHTHPLPSSIS